MNVKQRLAIGIFPIASRRHQPRDWGTFQKFPHMWERSESLTVIFMWILTPVIALIAPVFQSRWNSGDVFILMLILDIYVLYEIKRS